jgi:16S rRNA (adenine1518-N6/adenine1519-N6)-dimethyltransferase
MPSELTQTIKNIGALHDRVRMKKLGQHFLTDPRILSRIVDAAEPLGEAIVVEIGPGPGGLTQEILRRSPKKLFVIEKDERFINRFVEVTAFNEDARMFDYRRVIDERCAQTAAHCLPSETSLKKSKGNPLNIWNAIRIAVAKKEVPAIDLDARTFSPALIRQLFSCEATTKDHIQGNIKIISNLPYNVGIAIYINMLRQLCLIESMTLMFQKEVAERILDNPDSRNFGGLAMVTQHFTEARRVMRLAPGAFLPPPKVYSDVIHLTRRNDVNFEIMDDLLAFGAELFQHRRKTLRNRIKSMGVVDDILSEVCSSPKTSRD